MTGTREPGGGRCERGDGITTPRLLDTNGASKYVGGVKSARWFKDQARAGLIRAYQLGQTWCFDPADLEEFIASNFCDPANYGRKPKRVNGRGR